MKEGRREVTSKCCLQTFDINCAENLYVLPFPSYYVCVHFPFQSTPAKNNPPVLLTTNVYIANVALHKPAD